jgi:hypothetical protein
MTPAFRAKASVRLSQLPAETLADALLELAEFSKDARNLIENLIISPEECVAAFKRKLSGIVATYLKINHPDKAKCIRRDAFLRSPSRPPLDQVAEFAPAEEVDSLKKQTQEATLSDPKFNTAHLHFLLETGAHLMANEYLLSCHEQLNGDDYGSLPKLATTFASLGYPLAASLIWRALTDSVLARATFKAYPHAARYLKLLHQHAESVSQWQGHTDHESYLRQLQTNHARKSGFWKHVPDELRVT